MRFWKKTKSEDKEDVQKLQPIVDVKNNIQVELKSVKVLTDEVEAEPGFDFENYSSTIVNFVMGSTPQFSVGVYGEWGTGKTTLMKMVEKKLQILNSQDKSTILTIWFNAWRYEREEQFAMIALMKTLAFGMAKHEKFSKVSDIMLNGLKILGKDVLRSLALQTILTEKGVDEFENKFSPKMNFLNKLDKDTIYFDGLKTIQEEMKKITSDGKSRIVVFIDDLDRCSPTKALEVFESIKVFLDILGIVYVIGLSHETIAKLISKEYQESGVKGEHYIRKIIQIPIRIPPWSNSDIGKLIEKQIIGKLDHTYSKIIQEHSQLISHAAESNPRELKRFINNIILALELFGKKESIKYDELIIVEALKSRWNILYTHYSSDPDFRQLISELLNMSTYERVALLHFWENGEVKNDDEKKIIDEMSTDTTFLNPSFYEPILNIDESFWEFLQDPHILSILENIKDWEVYRRITSATEDISPDEALKEMAKEASKPPLAYCVKCRAKITMNNPVETKLKNGRPAVKGTCPNCGTNVFRIGSIPKEKS